MRTGESMLGRKGDGVLWGPSGYRYSNVTAVVWVRPPGLRNSTCCGSSQKKTQRTKNETHWRREKSDSFIRMRKLGSSPICNSEPQLCSQWHLRKSCCLSPKAKKLFSPVAGVNSVLLFGEGDTRGRWSEGHETDLSMGASREKG